MIGNDAVRVGTRTLHFAGRRQSLLARKKINIFLALTDSPCSSHQTQKLFAIFGANLDKDAVRVGTRTLQIADAGNYKL